MRSRSNGGIIGAYQLPSQNFANGVFFIHDAAIYNTGANPIWPLGTGFIYSATGGTISTAADNNNYKTHTFTANGTFTVSTGAAYIDILLVGGGGSSAYEYFGSGTQSRSCGGGGGGTVALVQGLFVDAGTTFTVEVGAGGTMGSYGASALPGVNGNPSKITSNKGHSVIARGGGAGGGVAQNALVGGSGGGGYKQWISTATYNVGPGANTGTIDSYSVNTATINYYQNIGGQGNTSGSGTYNSATAGGGGGAAEPGYSGDYSLTPSLKGCGGNGYLWNKTGYYYGAGGAGGSYSTASTSGLYFTGIRAAEGTTGTSAAGYGVGGSGRNVNSAATSEAPASGSSGTVIFVYRYR